jgi:hypothetical protein
LRTTDNTAFLWALTPDELEALTDLGRRQRCAAEAVDVWPDIYTDVLAISERLFSEGAAALTHLDRAI